MPHQSVTDQERIIAAAPFETWYGSLQSMFSQMHPTTQETPRLVTNQENNDQPIHRWYSLKESFAASLPTWVRTWMQNQYNHTVQQVCDPFLGSGTTGVALGTLPSTSVIGIEYNPFIRFVAATKASVSSVCTQSLAEQIYKLTHTLPSYRTFSVPDLTTLRNETYSPPANIQYILGEVHRIHNLVVDNSIKQVLLLGVAAIINDAVHLHKDGCALRYHPKPMDVPLNQKLLSRWQYMLSDICQFQSQHGQTNTPLFNVYSGSATNLKQLHTLSTQEIGINNKIADTSIFSPPYLNSFDYSEVYKLELWLLGFIETYDMWRELRLGTLRSHQAIAFPPTNHLRSDHRMQHIADQLDQMVKSSCLPDKQRSKLSRELLGYFDDMYLVLCEQWRILKDGGILAYIVANSRHYFLPVATDVIIGEIARCLGFEPLDLAVLRKRNGRTRQKLYLRESVAFFRKPV
ncbi:hypothetical protein [Candidatus Oscillochloris fontis]|uniref:hypothetical protein n=1 Tax=Candidatus Oscillochloris fontis TaxID=2496868 RepID=UPI00101C2AEA|nr:hypothetical protein [Candidatus Oscillochloris fontis]